MALTNEELGHVKRRSDYGTKRKSFKRCLNRKPRSSNRRRKIDEARIELYKYAPAHSHIYTISYNRSHFGKYIYMDVFVVNNLKLYKITKLVANLLGHRIMESVHTFKPHALMSVRIPKTVKDITQIAVMELESLIVKEFSTIMFQRDDGYTHESILKMLDASFVPPKKDFRVRRNYVMR